MQVYPNRFSQEISQGLKPCYMVFGDEPQQKFEAIELIRHYAKQQGFTERQVLVADKDFSWHTLTEATQSLSLFSDKQYIELELPTGKPGAEGSKVLQSIADSLGDDTLLLLHGPRVGKDVQKAKWFKVLDGIGQHLLCYPLEGRQLASWVEQQFRQFNVSTDAAGIKLIADFCEGNMLAARQEVEKIALVYAGKQVGAETLEQVVVDQSRFNVFQLVDVMLSGDKSRCVKMLYRLESEGIEPNIIIWALIREWQTLWALKQQAQSNQPINWMKFGIWRNRQTAYQAALARLSIDTLDSIRRTLETADLAFKESVVVRPYVQLCHLCMLFMGVPLSAYPLAVK